MQRQFINCTGHIAPKDMIIGSYELERIWSSRGLFICYPRIYSEELKKKTRNAHSG